MEILTVEQLCSNFSNFLSAESYAKITSLYGYNRTCALIGCFLVMTRHYKLGVQGIYVVVQFYPRFKFYFPLL